MDVIRTGTDARRPTRLSRRTHGSYSSRGRKTVPASPRQAAPSHAKAPPRHATPRLQPAAALHACVRCGNPASVRSPRAASPRFPAEAGRRPRPGGLAYAASASSITSSTSKRPKTPPFVSGRQSPRPMRRPPTASHAVNCAPAASNL